MGIWDCLDLCLTPIDCQHLSLDVILELLNLHITHHSRPHTWVSRVDVEFCHARSKIRVFLLTGLLLR